MGEQVATSPMPSTPNGASEGLPWGTLLALSSSGFLAIFTETVPAGLLPVVSADLGISRAAAGQLVTAYALGSLTAAIPLVALTRSLARERVLIMAMSALGLFNLVTALAPWYPAILVARCAAGAAAALIWGVLTGYVRRLVSAQLQGRALAIAGMGQPIALAVGVPAGAFAASFIGWRGVFGVGFVAAAALALWLWATAQHAPGAASRRRAPLGHVLRLPGVAPVLGVTAAWILAHNMLYTYTASLLHGWGIRLDLALAVLGVSSILGIGMVAAVVDRVLRPVTLAGLLGMATAAVLWAIGSPGPALAVIAIILWGVASGGAPILVQTALADRAGDHTDAAQSLFVTTFNLAVAGGGLFGGVLLSLAGAQSLAWAGALLTAVAGAAVWVRRDAFPVGPRHAAPGVGESVGGD